MVEFNEEEYTAQWSREIEDQALKLDESAEIIKSVIISNDCILIEDKNFKSMLSLCKTPYFYTQNNLSF